MSKFYIVGTNTRANTPKGNGWIGDLLVYAGSREEALSKVRKTTGTVPNPGDAFILGSSYADSNNDVTEAMKEEAMRNGTSLIWATEF